MAQCTQQSPVITITRLLPKQFNHIAQHPVQGIVGRILIIGNVKEMLPGRIAQLPADLPLAFEPHRRFLNYLVMVMAAPLPLNHQFTGKEMGQDFKPVTAALQERGHLMGADGKIARHFQHIQQVARGRRGRMGTIINFGQYLEGMTADPHHAYLGPGFENALSPVAGCLHDLSPHCSVDVGQGTEIGIIPGERQPLMFQKGVYQHRLTAPFVDNRHGRRLHPLILTHIPNQPQHLQRLLPRRFARIALQKSSQHINHR